MAELPALIACRLAKAPTPCEIAAVSPVFKIHIVLGLTIFLIFPFTRLVHIWSGFATVYYLIRPYQVVRQR